jgi:hypothetical protein
MSRLTEVGASVCQITGRSHSEHLALLRGAEAELSEVKVPNTQRARKQTRTKGLRLSEEIDQRLEILTALAKDDGSLRLFEKSNDLIRLLINLEYLRRVGPLYGRA